MAQAIRYTLSRWAPLTRPVANARLEMANNAAERGIRPLALARKNHLICGSDSGGQRAACIYTISETTKLNGINRRAYLADVPARMADYPRNIDALLPWSGHRCQWQLRPYCGQRLALTPQPAPKLVPGLGPRSSTRRVDTQPIQPFSILAASTFSSVLRREVAQSSRAKHVQQE